MPYRILVIEDNPNNRLLVRDSLSFKGYAVLEAENGEDGVSIARQERPDLVLLDIQMPGMDGFAVLRALRAEPVTRELPVVALTALAMRGDQEKILVAGFNGYLAKPFCLEELIRTVQRFLPQEKTS